jgi:hypothetical protein
MSVGEESITTSFSGPLLTTGQAEPGFQNKPLNNNAGTYTVYKIFDSLTNPNANYKMYVVKLNISNLGTNQQSLNNTLPAPYCSLSRMAYPTVLFVNIPTSAVQVTLASNGQSFDIQNTGTGLLVSAVGAFYIIGY